MSRKFAARHQKLYMQGVSVITVEAKVVGTRVIATLKIKVGSEQFIYTVQFADQGSDAANEAEARRKLREILEDVLGALASS